MGRTFIVRSLVCTAFIVLPGLLAGCEKPCEELELKVCNDLQWDRKCEMLQEPERRERLIDETCTSILKHLKR